MSRLKWDQVGERFYETGVSKGVLYPFDTTTNTYINGVAWNGLSNVSESPSGAEPSDIYADNIKYLSLMSNETYSATIEAYTYPDEFKECNGEAELVSGVNIGQQTRKQFGFSFQSIYGNDTLGNDYSYKITLVYGCKASPSEKGHATTNESPEAATMSWSINTTPVEVKNYRPTASVVIDASKFTTEAQKAKLKAFEDIIYGRDADPTTETEALVARLPLPDEVKTLLTVAAG